MQPRCKLRRWQSPMLNIDRLVASGARVNHGARVPPQREQVVAPERAALLAVHPVLTALGVLGVYWVSALVLAARDEVYLFGADTVLYMEMAKGQIVERLGSYYAFDRITRFHPLTTAMVVVWMKALGFLTPWLGPKLLLKAMFATVGAAGVAAAMWAFAAVVPARQARLWGLIYAFSLGVWYFSSIEECKIVTATLATLYIAAYLHLRARWTTRGAVLLTAILLLACLNEIIAALLLAIPALDTLVRRGWDLRHGRWIVWHGLAAPAAFVLLELVVKPNTGAAALSGPAGEGASHLSMLVFYVSQNDFSAATLYSFLVNWAFFNIAAPAMETSLAPAAWPEYMAYFEPVLRNYLSSPVSSGLVALFAIVLAAGLLRPQRLPGDSGLAGVAAGLAGYALLRGTFFFVVNPSECILYGSGVTLAHLLLLAIPFRASRLPGKRAILTACVLLLLIVNGAFIIGN
jgi:hypothetical protein